MRMGFAVKTRAPVACPFYAINAEKVLRVCTFARFGSPQMHLRPDLWEEPYIV